MAQRAARDILSAPFIRRWRHDAATRHAAAMPRDAPPRYAPRRRCRRYAREVPRAPDTPCRHAAAACAVDDIRLLPMLRRQRCRRLMPPPERAADAAYGADATLNAARRRPEAPRRVEKMLIDRRRRRRA